MKRFLILALLLLLAGTAVVSDSILAPRGFAGKLWHSTLALYGTEGESTHFDCTIEPIAKISGGYRLLTAGHCVQDVPADVTFSVADEIGGPLTPVTLVKVYEGQDKVWIDFALFDLHTTKHYDVMDLGIDNVVSVGDRTLNPHFSYGIGKQLSPGVIASRRLINTERCGNCEDDFLVQEYATNGASGSPILSAKTHQVIGILVEDFTFANIGLIIEPISRFELFLAEPNQPHPTPETED